MNEQIIKDRLGLLDKKLKEIGFEKDTKWSYIKGNIVIWLDCDNLFDFDVMFDINIIQGEDMIISKKYNIKKIDSGDFLNFFSDLKNFVKLFEKLFLRKIQ